MNRLVLVAEDDEIIYESIESSLAREGIQTIHCKEGRSALEFFLKNPVPVVLTDLRMPGMSGNELVERLLALSPKPIILIQSVVDDIQMIITYMKRGVFDYIIKPYSLQELVIRIKKAFELFELLEYRLKMQSLENYHPNLNEDSPPVLLEKFDKLVKNILLNYHKQGEGLHLEEPMYLKLKNRYDASSPILWEVERLGFHDKIPNEDDKIPVTNLIFILEGAIKKLEKYLILKNQTVYINELNESFKNYFILLDTESFHTVLVELILNAIKFGDRSSVIFINISLKADSLLEIKIENSISENFYLPPTLDLFFEPFYLTHVEDHLEFPTANIGLGLTLVRKIVANHKGEIRAFLQETENKKARKISIQIHVPLI